MQVVTTSDRVTVNAEFNMISHEIRQKLLKTRDFSLKKASDNKEFGYE